MLRFKIRFRDAIWEGRKTTTLRRWSRPFNKAQSLVKAPGIGSLWIESIETVEWLSLTDADAQADGFDTLAELQRAVEEIYPQLHSDGKRWYRIRFILRERAAASAKSSTPNPNRVPTLPFTADDAPTSESAATQLLLPDMPVPKPLLMDPPARQRLADALREQLAQAIQSVLDTGNH